MFLNKEDLESEARRLGIVFTDDMKYGQKQKLVADGRKAAGEPAWNKSLASVKKEEPIGRRFVMPAGFVEQEFATQESEAVVKKSESFSKQSDKELEAAKKRAKRLLKGRRPNDPLSQYEGKTIVISPEIVPTVNSPAYSENIGDDLDIEEVYFDPDTLDNVDDGASWKSMTYRVKGKTGHKMMAKSHLPKMQAGLTFRTDKHAAIATFNGQSGYVFKHPSLPCVKLLLVMSGYWEEYKPRFSNGDNMFYLGGILCCDISYTDYVFAEIEKKAKRNAES